MGWSRGKGSSLSFSIYPFVHGSGKGFLGPGTNTRFGIRREIGGVQRAELSLHRVVACIGLAICCGVTAFAVACRCEDAALFNALCIKWLQVTDRPGVNLKLALSASMTTGTVYQNL